jgi:hypothetical protein
MKIIPGDMGRIPATGLLHAAIPRNNQLSGEIELLLRPGPGRGESMKKTMVPFLILLLGTMLCGNLALAQYAGSGESEDPPPPPAKFGKYSDFIVKGYSISFSTGHFSGATYLKNWALGDKTFYTDGANDILAYFPSDETGESLPVSTFKDENGNFVYDAAEKEVEPGESYNLKVGIYIADNFHLDLAGSYIQSRASTTMMHYFLDEPELNGREEVDADDGFKIYKGGLALMYDAEPAKFLGITPRLGFGLGGIINRYTELEDKTALYLEANLAFNYRLFKNLDLTGQIDSATFAFDVDELGYSNMIHYTSYSIGACWFINVLPDDILAQHQADKR